MTGGPVTGGPVATVPVLEALRVERPGAEAAARNTPAPSAGGTGADRQEP